MKRTSAKRITIGAGLGVLVLIASLWLLTRTLGNYDDPLYAGKSLDYWLTRLRSGDIAASNEAVSVVASRIIPQLTSTILQDTNDSSLRLFLIDALNGLPGVWINFSPASARRTGAASSIGQLGPAAKPAVPALIQALQGDDPSIHKAAISALGKIQSDPDVVIPLLIRCLDDPSVNDEAATALANYGPLARAAVPKLIPLLQAPDDDARLAARKALLKIDLEAAAKAGVQTN